LVQRRRDGEVATGSYEVRQEDPLAPGGCGGGLQSPEATRACRIWPNEGPRQRSDAAKVELEGGEVAEVPEQIKRGNEQPGR
jgi:hypothetical protein